MESDLCLRRDAGHFLLADITLPAERIRRISFSFKDNAAICFIIKQMQVHCPPIRICKNDMIRRGVGFGSLLESLLVQGMDETRRLSFLHKQVNVLMFPCLFAQQGVHAPSAVDENIYLQAFSKVD